MVEKNPRVRVAAVIIEDGKILLVRHEKDGRSYWLLPGGGVDYGETLPQALTRELKEETNLDVKVGNLLFVSDAINPQRTRHIINVYFETVIVGGELTTAVDERLQEVKFIEISHLSDLTLFPNIKEELQLFSRGQSINMSYLGDKWDD